MGYISAINMIDIIGKTLNFVDPRLVNHGRRVANMVYGMTSLQNLYSPRQLRDIYIATFLHDIGAYKTEEIDRLIHFETRDVWDHSIYGSLFAKHLSPLEAFAPALLFHHADCAEIRHCPESCRDLAQIIHVADRIDVLSQAGVALSRSNYEKYFESQRDVRFGSGVLDLVEQAGILEENDRYDGTKIFHAISFTDAEIESYLRMLVLSIDFRSPQTVTHTMAAAAVSGVLAELLGMEETEREKIRTGAMLHDIGKQGIPTEILESPDKLSEREMALMHTHVELSEYILKDNMDGEIVRLAVRHHEKLDGSGYHRGLGAAELTAGERLIAVADILSALFGVRSYKAAFSQEKVCGILDGMAREGKIDRDIVSLAIANFDAVIERADAVSSRIVASYDAINREFRELRALTDEFGPCGRPAWTE